MDYNVPEMGVGSGQWNYRGSLLLKEKGARCQGCGQQHFLGRCHLELLLFISLMVVSAASSADLGRSDILKWRGTRIDGLMRILAKDVLTTQRESLRKVLLECIHKKGREHCIMTLAFFFPFLVNIVSSLTINIPI